jgi:hypothetical protein
VISSGARLAPHGPSQKVTILILRFWALFSACRAFLLVAASASQGAKQKKAEKAKKQKKRTGQSRLSIRI